MEKLPATTSYKALDIIKRRDGDEDIKSEYLSLRACYFSTVEAREKLGLTLKTIEQWREDPDFRSAEQDNITDFQDTSCKEVLRITQVRNLRMLLDLDHDFIKRVAKAKKINKTDLSYLKTLRNTYSLEGLSKLSAIIGGQAPLNFAQFITLISMQDKVEQNSPASPYIEIEGKVE